MGQRYRRLQSGDPVSAISADAYNELLDLVEDHRQSKPAAEVDHKPQPQRHVRVRNDTGGDLNQYAVVGIAGPVIGPGTNTEAFKQELAISGVTPADPDHLGRFVVLQQPLKAGAIGDAVLAGLTIVKLDVTNNDDEHADIIDGDATALGTGKGSARVLWTGSGTGPVWALVFLGYEAGVIVSPNDTTPRPLIQKIVLGNNLSGSVSGEGGDETWTLNAQDTNTDTRIDLEQGSDASIPDAKELNIVLPLKLTDLGNGVGRLEIDWSQIQGWDDSTGSEQLFGHKEGTVQWLDGGKTCATS